MILQQYLIPARKGSRGNRRKGKIIIIKKTTASFVRVCVYACVVGGGVFQHIRKITANVTLQKQPEYTGSGMEVSEAVTTLLQSGYEKCQQYLF